MNGSIQDKLRQAQEKRQLDAFRNRLDCLECGEFLPAEAFPASLAQAMETSLRVATARRSRLFPHPETLRRFAGAFADDGESVTGAWRDWFDRMCLGAEIGTERFYLSTPFEYFPWLECRVAKAGWQDELGEITDFDFRLVSAEKTRFLAIHHDEHWIDAYWCEL